MLSPSQSFCIPLARREESVSISKAPAPPPLTLTGVGFFRLAARSPGSNSHYFMTFGLGPIRWNLQPEERLRHAFPKNLPL